MCWRNAVQRRLLTVGNGEAFLHPYHVIPSVEFLSASVEMRHFLKSHTLMEADAVVCEEGVGVCGKRYAGIHVPDAAPAQPFFKSIVEPLPYPVAPVCGVNIHCRLDSPLVGGAVFECVGVGVAEYLLLVVLRHEIGEA